MEENNEMDLSKEWIQVDSSTICYILYLYLKRYVWLAAAESGLVQFIEQK